jgi:hypothetical protein
MNAYVSNILLSLQCLFVVVIYYSSKAKLFGYRHAGTKG